MDSVARLEAIEEIRTLKSRYFRALDNKDWDLFGRLFTVDAIQDMSEDIAFIAMVEAGLMPAKGYTEGGAEIARTVSTGIGDAVTFHIGGMDQIVIDDEDHAHAVWTMTDYIRAPDQPYDAAFQGLGNYDDEYVRIDGEWRIAKSVISHRTYKLPTVATPA